MARILALMRAAWLSAVSYRLAMVFSVLALLATVVPVYFVAQALQPVVSESIATEGRDFFAFLVVGMMALGVVIAALGAFPGWLGSAIATGTLEAVLTTPTRMVELVLGVSGYDLLWAGFKALLVLLAGVVLGVVVQWSAFPSFVLVLGLTALSYLAIGVVAGAVILVFRTSGPIIPGVVAATSLLGGVYYSTSVIPSWIQVLSQIVPLTYTVQNGDRIEIITAKQEQPSRDWLNPQLGYLASSRSRAIVLASASIFMPCASSGTPTMSIPSV